MLCMLGEDGHAPEQPEPEHLRELQCLALGAHRTSLRYGLLPKDPRLRALAMRMLRPDPEDRPDVDVVLRQVRLLLQDLQGEERSPARHE